MLKFVLGPDYTDSFEISPRPLMMLEYRPLMMLEFIIYVVHKISIEDQMNVYLLS